jgi:hypothetical protein
LTYDLFVPFINPQLEAAKRTFLDKHPLAKDREQAGTLKTDPLKGLGEWGGEGIARERALGQWCVALNTLRVVLTLAPPCNGSLRAGWRFCKYASGWVVSTVSTQVGMPDHSDCPMSTHPVKPTSSACLRWLTYSSHMPSLTLHCVFCPGCLAAAELEYSVSQTNSLVSCGDRLVLSSGAAPPHSQDKGGAAPGKLGEPTPPGV